MNKKLIGYFVIILERSLAFAGPLYTAAMHGDLGQVRDLLASGVSADDRSYPNKEFNPLDAAASQGHLSVVQELLKAGAGINSTSLHGGATPLMSAAIGGHLGVVQELLKAEADINAKKTNGSTALEAASNRGNQNVIMAIREWSIENQVLITSRADQEILDGSDKGSYLKDFASFKERKRAILEETTGIPTKGPGKHILEYLGEK